MMNRLVRLNEFLEAAGKNAIRIAANTRIVISQKSPQYVAKMKAGVEQVKGAATKAKQRLSILLGKTEENMDDWEARTASEDAERQRAERAKTASTRTDAK